MRYPDLEKTIVLPNGDVLSQAETLQKLVWGHPSWSTDEASIASFDRCIAALKRKPFALEDEDFHRVCGVLRSINFNPEIAVELATMRNAFVLSPRELAPVAQKKASSEAAP